MSEEQSTIAATASPRPHPLARHPRPSRRVDRLPPWRVLLHNDDVNDMLHVVNSIVDLTP